MPSDRQLTFAPHGHLLTHAGAWSPDGKWIVYDIRSDPAGAVFDGTRIERVNVDDGEVQVLYESGNSACCGVATFSPVEPKVAFILGPEHPTAEWFYAANRRRGVIVDAAKPGVAINLDARDLTPPFTPGALRGGSHVHLFSGDGEWVSFTYQDQPLERFAHETDSNDIDQRNVGVSVRGRAVSVPRTHARNHDGAYFSVLVTRTVARPAPGSDQISRAFEEAWVGRHGYQKADGTRQHRAIAFQGDVVSDRGEKISEVFIVDLPEDVTVPGDGPLQGTPTRRPFPPRGAAQRRLTDTSRRKFPGIQGPRHWLRSSPDGARIAFLMRDDAGIVQLWSVSPNSGEAARMTRNPWDIASAFTWSPDGRSIAHIMDNSIFVAECASGRSRRVTPRPEEGEAPRPEACVFSPDGTQVAYVREVRSAAGLYNQIFVATIE